MKKYIVYRIINLINGKIYIGVHITKNINDSYMGSGKLIKSSIKKYGVKNFKKDILAIFDNPEDMFKMESQIVNKDFIKDNKTYNIKEGGKGGWNHVNENYSLEKRIEIGKEHGSKAGSWQDVEKRRKIINNIPLKKRKAIGKKLGDNYGGQNKLTIDEVNKRLEIIKDVNLEKFGWVKDVSSLLNITHTQARRFIEFYYKGNVYKRK